MRVGGGEEKEDSSRSCIEGKEFQKKANFVESGC